MTTIIPTVGRMLHYIVQDEPFFGVVPDVLAAIVCGVNDDGTINLSVFDSTGSQYPRTNVRLMQDGEATTQRGSHARWMPFQIGQAAAQATPVSAPITKTYSDGTVVTSSGSSPLPELSPAQQDAAATPATEPPAVTEPTAPAA